MCRARFRFRAEADWTDVLGLLIQIAYVLTAFATIVSFVDYLVQFKNSTIKPS